MTQKTTIPLHIAGEWDIYPRAGWKISLRRWLKQTMFALYLHCGMLQLRDALLSCMGRSRIVVLYYHRVGWVDVLSKPTRQFRAELAYLSRHYDCMTMRQLMDRLKSSQPLKRKTAVITFDDGYRDNFLNAFPELKRAGVPATFFVATGFIGSTRAFPHDTRAMERGLSVRDNWEKLTWDDLRLMQEAGMEIGSHTVEHVNMGSADEATMRREIQQSLETLNRELGDRQRCFSFPWGGPADVSPLAVQAIRDAGYYAATTTTHGAVRRGDDLYLLRRIDAGNGQATPMAVLAAIQGFGCGWLACLLRWGRRRKL